MTAVRPSARFGEIEFDGDTVAEFNEKPQLHDGWINGGFFVIEPKFLNLIKMINNFFDLLTTFSQF